MSPFLSIIRKIFLVKEIVSKEGLVHFKRYRLLETPWFRIYIHQICKSDEEKHFHNHPWKFFSFILKGAYSQKVYIKSEFNMDCIWECAFQKHDSFTMNQNAYHKITLQAPEVWSFFVAYGKKTGWGYLLDDKSHIDHKAYRELKNEQRL